MMGPVLEELLAMVDERVEPERADAVREFARAYLRRRSDDGAPRTPQALLGEALGAFELAAGRDGAPVAVRAFNPTPERDGYQAAGSVLETSTDDLPFLVDSVTAELHARGHLLRRVRHPVIGTERDGAGRIVAVRHPEHAAHTESVMHFELDRRLEPEALAALEDAVRAVLADVRRVVGDFAAMTQRLAAIRAMAQEAVAANDAEDVAETVAFLDWLGRDNFIFLGAHGPDGPPLGLATAADAPPADAPAEELLVVAKSARLSPVHRRVRMDDVVIAGCARLLGLFTRKAYAEPASETPLLHRKLRRILAAEDLIPGSHDYKAAVSLFDSFPKDELFAATTQDLGRAVVTLLDTQGDQVRLLGRRHADGSSASFIAALPRASYDAELLERLRALLGRRLNASRVDAHEVLGEGERVRVHFTVDAPEDGVDELGMRELEQAVAELATTWDDRVRDALIAGHGDERGRMLAARWAGRLPGSYKAAVDPSAATHDIESFERLFTSGRPFLVALHNEHRHGGELTRVGLYRLGGKVELSKVMPILEDLGLRVIEERPTRLEGGSVDTWLQDFGVLGPTDLPLCLDEVGERVAAVIDAVWSGEAESDSLNRLVVTTGLDWRRLAILRAYRRYRQRIGSRFTEGYQHDVIAANPHVTEKLMTLFERRFDPSAPRDEEAEGRLRAAILEDLDAVASLDHDRILRNQLGLIEATVRTNAYRSGRRSLAFKLRSAQVPAIPQPPPLFEIYVYSPEVEGIHLRGGRIARGGIRWSDRMDYRTEVFGLMRAQVTKNAVIVPDGAKGGFYLRRRPEDPGALKDEVVRQYVTYISGLLDLTDNLVDGEVVHPDGVRVLDEDDTYLVVAADKGTAALSDTANRVAARYRFWLGDAFASGGSKGYDHKALGITARGAWESLKRHFRELDLDPAVDAFTVVGIGDMSGDVFGNGMLLSDQIRLVAAYDHRHVFIDPDPGAAAGFTERRRLFEAPGSSWDDYDREAISAGGGVWSRAAKSIALSAPARQALGIDVDEPLAPTDVIRAILRAPVDVLWNGGIGTVVKAATESDDDARDRSSDAIRVDGGELRCRVVAEGGNLGFTQRGRIEFARGGGRVNADFIDNAGGVDCSDREVNLKILLDLAVRGGELDADARDALLVEVTQDVADHVIYDCFLQAQMLAQEARGAAGRMFAYEDLMAALEEEGALHRDIEALPSSEEMAERRRAGDGLQAPELAVLLAYAKRSITAALLASDLPEDPCLEPQLRAYFPRTVVARLEHLLERHPLRRELVATIAANHVVDALGPTFVSRLVAEQGAQAADVVRAYVMAREATGAEARWAAIERLGRTVERGVQWELLEGVDWLVEATARWYLVNAPGENLAMAIATGRDGFDRVGHVLGELVGDDVRHERDARAGELRDAGVPDDLAHSHVFNPSLIHAPDAVAVAEATGRPVEDVMRAFFAIGEGVALGWLEREIEHLPTATRMQRWALHAARDDILRARRELAQRALTDAPGAGADEAVEAFLEGRRPAIARLSGFARALAAEGATDLAGLTLAVRQLRALVD